MAQQQPYFSISSDLGVVSEHSDEFANESQQQTLTKNNKNHTNFNTASLFEGEEDDHPINLKL